MAEVNRRRTQRGEVALGINPDNGAVPLQTDYDGNLNVSIPLYTLPVSEFGELIVTERTPIIELNSAYGTSLIRDVIVTSGSGYVSSTAGEILIGLTTGDGFSSLESAEVGRYVPGYEAEIGIGIRIATDPVGNQQFLWGGETPEGLNGLVFGEDATGVFVARRNNGSFDTKVYQSSWNVDKLDGTGRSGITLDVSEGIIYQIVFTWYGYGTIKWGIVAEVDGQQQFVVVHKEKVLSQPSIRSPNLVLIASVDNAGTTTPALMYVGGRQYSIIGKYVPKFRKVGQTRGSVSTSTTAEPLVSFRTRAGYLDRSIRLDGYTVKPATSDVVLEVRLGGTLTGASWSTPTNHTTAETAVEMDISANAIEGGVVIDTDYASSGQANKGSFSSEAQDIDIPESQIVTLCARTLSGTGTIITHFKLREEW